MATAKQAHALVTYFSNAYKSRYGTEPVLNRHKGRWFFDSILMDMSVDEVEGLIDYYMTTMRPSHSLDNFSANYDKYLSAMQDSIKDQDELRVLRERTRKRTEEWLKKIDKH